jgi:catechol 2,3-dioxygenase-like lactoylglutathione lyase family enzyme
MRKSILSLLFLTFGLAAAMPTGVRAATLYGGDYAGISVPDMAQAVAFFQDVLDCEVIGPASEPSARDTPASRLLSCNAGSIVELFQEQDSSPSPAAHRSRSKAAQPLQFVTVDVVHAGQWLKHEHVSVKGAPHRLTSGPQAGRMVLDFRAPWGLRLQLLGSREAIATDGTLATVAQSGGG